MSTARIDSAGTVTTLDGKADPEEVVTEADVKDSAKLAKMLGRALATIAALRRAWKPRRIFFQDIATTGAIGNSVDHYLQHNFGGRVHWWVTDWGVYGDVAPVLCREEIRTTADTLVLSSFAIGTMTICVEEVG